MGQRTVYELAARWSDLRIINERERERDLVDML